MSATVPEAWAAPVAQALAALEARLADPSLGPGEVLAEVERAISGLPDLYWKMDRDALAEVFEAGMGAATVVGIRRNLSA